MDITGNPTVDTAREIFAAEVPAEEKVTTQVEDDKPSEGDKSGETAPPSTLTKEDLVTSFREAVGKPTEQAPKQLTPEEINKAMNVFELDPETYQAFVSGEESGPVAFNRIRDGLIKQAATVANYIVEQRMQELRPVQDFAAEQRAEKERQTFFDTNKDLVGREQVVNMVRAQMIQEGKQFSTVQEAMTALATQTRQALKDLGVNPSSDGGTPTNPAPGDDNRMASLSTGSGSGGSASSAGGGSKTAREIFG